MPTKKDNPSSEISRLICQLQQHAFRAASTHGELSAANHLALQFFGQANTYSRTVSALALFQGIARSSASVLVANLVKEGFLVRKPRKSDKRSVQLDVTIKGKRILRADPFYELTYAVESLPPKTQQNLLTCLALISAEVSGKLRKQEFGNCGDCKYFVNGTAYRCEQMNVNIAPKDSVKLCVNFKEKTKKKWGHFFGQLDSVL